MEFACSHCGQTLRVPDGSESRTAKCPACGGLSTVPGGRAPAHGGENSGKPTAFAGSGFVPDPAAYPAYAPQFQRRAALDRVAGPATGIIVCAILNIILWIAITAFYSVIAFVAPMQEDIEAGPEEAMFLFIGMIVIYGTMGLLAIAANIVSIVGAVGMRKLRSRGFSMAAAILQMIPCFSSCWPLGLGMGIWASC